MDNTCTDCNQLVRHCTCNGATLRAGVDGQAEGVEPRRSYRLLAECAQYLKEGETPAERIEREMKDTHAVLQLLVREKLRHESLRRAAEALDHYAWSMVSVNNEEGFANLNGLLKALRVELKMPVETLTFKEALDFTLTMLTDTARQHDDLRQAVADAAPIVAEYAKANQKHHYGETLQDPCGAHAWLDRNGA